MEINKNEKLLDATPTVSLFEADFDKSKLPPIDQKRLVTFVNHFLIDTVKFLNNFCNNCEERFVTLESKLQKINAELVVIESKIFQGQLKDPLEGKQIDRVLEANKDEVDISTATDDTSTSNENSSKSDDAAEETGVKVSDDVRYAKYFKMKQFGVQVEALKLKMSAEGLDVSLLDQPDKILADGIKKPVINEGD